MCFTRRDPPENKRNDNNRHPTNTEHGHTLLLSVSQCLSECEVKKEEEKEEKNVH